MTSRRIAAGTLGLTGLIHLVLAPEYFGEQAYIGALFVAGGLTCLVLAARLWRRDELPSWLLGGLVAAGMGVGFVLSRTTGLPGFKESEWELSGIVTLVCEAAFIALATTALGRPRTAAARPRAPRGRAVLD